MLFAKRTKVSPKKILVLCLPGIGDALMATPMIKVLDQIFPEAQIDVFCIQGGVANVFKNNPHVDRVHYINLYPGRLSLKKLFSIIRLRRYRYDLSFLCYPAYRREYHFLHWFVGARRKVAHSFPTGHISEGHFLNNTLLPADSLVHNVINNLNLLSGVGVGWQEYLSEQDIAYNLCLSPGELAGGREFWQKLNWNPADTVALHPGSTGSPAALLRRWPLSNFAELATWLIANEKKVLLFVGPDESDLGQELVSLIANEENCHLVKNVDLRLAAAIMINARCLICNDNGFGHIANALGVPIVSLWASTNHQWSLPLRTDLVELVRPANFLPWYTYTLKRRVPDGAQSGMDLISVDQVKRASISHL